MRVRGVPDGVRRDRCRVRRPATDRAAVGRARAGRSARRGRGPRRTGRATRSSRVRRVDAVVVGERDEVGLEQRERGVPRAREPARGARGGGRRGPGARASSRSTRPSAFWSTTTTRKRGASAPRASRRSAASSSVRSTVATTRSKPSRKRLPPPAQATLTRRGRWPSSSPSSPSCLPPATPRRRSARRCAACSARRLDDLELARRRRRLARRHARAARTRRRRAAAACCGIPSRSASPARSTSASTTARGAYVARMDADDVALPLARAARRADPPTPAVAIVGTGMIDLHDDGRSAPSTGMPDGRARGPLGGALLRRRSSTRPCSSTGGVLERHGLRYDTLVRRERGLRPVGAAPRARGGGQPARGARPLPQASDGRPRRGVRSSSATCQRRVALRQIAALVPSLDERAAPSSPGAPARDCRCQARGGARQRRALARARRRPSSGATAAARRAGRRRGRSRGHTARATRDGRRSHGPRCELDPALPLRGVAKLGRRRRRREQSATPPPAWLARSARDRARAADAGLPRADPLPDGDARPVATRPELDLTVLYAGGSVAAADVDDRASPPRGLPRGRARPGPLPRAPARVSALARRLPRARGVAARGRRRLGVEHVRLAGRGALVPAAARPVRAPRREQRARRATGLAARGQGGGRPSDGARRGRGARRRHVGSRGNARPGRRAGAHLALRRHDRRRRGSVAEADRLASRRDELRAEVGLAPDDVAVLSVARLAPEKGLDTLVRAVAAAGDRRLVLVLAGAGPSASVSLRSQREPRRAARPAPERAVGADRRAIRARRRLRAPLPARAVGRRRQRGGGVRAPARPLRPGRRGASICSRTGGTARSSRPSDPTRPAPRSAPSLPTPRGAATPGVPRAT